jgi:hypothetical protein
MGRGIVVEISKGAVGLLNPTFPPSKADGNGREALDFRRPNAGQKDIQLILDGMGMVQE